ncbi:hypothetical protein BDZ89DRAFT_1165268, partial [Hymenopellis radicata]
MERIANPLRRMPSCVVILSHLEPFDLLRLSCVNKAFRVLIHSNPGAWRQARENLKTNNLMLPVLPMAPLGMTEASFINLVFNATNMCCEQSPPATSRRRTGLRWAQCGVIPKLPREYKTECNRFVRAWLARAAAEKAARKISDKVAVKERFNDIIERLTLEGCRNDVEWRDTKSLILAHPYSRRPERFTDSVCEKKLKPAILVLFEEGRIERLPEVIAQRREEFLELYARALTFLPRGMPRLNAIDIIHHDPFPSLMRLVEETDVNEEVPWMCLKEFAQVMLAAHQALRGAMDAQLFPLMRDHGLPQTREELALTRFKCDKCATVVAYTGVFAHSCRRGRDVTVERGLEWTRQYRWRSHVFVPREASVTRRLLYSELSSTPSGGRDDLRLYVCRTCHDRDAFNENKLLLMTWRGAAEYEIHDDWMFV